MARLHAQKCFACMRQYAALVALRGGLWGRAADQRQPLAQAGIDMGVAQEAQQDLSLHCFWSPDCAPRVAGPLSGGGVSAVRWPGRGTCDAPALLSSVKQGASKQPSAMAQAPCPLDILDDLILNHLAVRAACWACWTWVQAPPLHIVHEFCQDAAQWLRASPAHVCAVHCKAGRGLR